MLAPSRIIFDTELILASDRLTRPSRAPATLRQPQPLVHLAPEGGRAPTTCATHNQEQRTTSATARTGGAHRLTTDSLNAQQQTTADAIAAVVTQTNIDAMAAAAQMSGLPKHILTATALGNVSVLKQWIDDGGTISASRGAAVPSRHRRASSPG